MKTVNTEERNTPAIEALLVIRNRLEDPNLPRYLVENAREVEGEIIRFLEREIY